MQRATPATAFMQELPKISLTGSATVHPGRCRDCSNDPVRCRDVTDMRTVTTRVGAVFMLAAASIALAQASATAEPAGPQVRYTLSATSPSDFEVNYLTAQPPSMEAYNADPYVYLKKERVNVAPGAPWVFETTLADPQWAIITASTGVHAMTASPNPNCEIAIDGQEAVRNSGPYTANCQLSQW